MLFALLYALLRLLLDVVDVRLRVHDPEAELLLLRHQLRVVRRQVKRPQLNAADRTIMAALSERVNRSALVRMLVQPETVLGWHRELVRRRWAAFGRRRGPGRPAMDSELQKLILQMARDNPKWGCGRVRGELLKLGHRVAATAIRKLLRRNRIGPAPLRSRYTWKAFLRAQASAIRAHRLPQRRHRASEAALRPLIYGAGYSAGDLVRRDRPLRCCLGDPASQKGEPGAAAVGCARSLPDSRSRHQVRKWLGPCVRGRSCGRDPDTDRAVKSQF